MPEYQLLNTTDFVTTLEKEAVINFLLENLDAYMDTRENISRAVEYALSKFPHQGGFIILANENDSIIGAAVINRTNLEGYFAENILVYIASSAAKRGQGIGKELLRQSILFSKGDVMLRANPDVSKYGIFEQVGFKPEFQGMVLRRDH